MSNCSDSSKVMGLFRYADAYSTMLEVRDSVAPVYLTCFKVIVILVTLNMFVALLGSGYEAASEELKSYKEVHKETSTELVSKSDLQRVPTRATGLIDVVVQVYRLIVPQFQVVAAFNHNKDFRKLEGHEFNYPNNKIQKGVQRQPNAIPIPNAIPNADPQPKPTPTPTRIQRQPDTNQHAFHEKLLWRFHCTTHGLRTSRCPRRVARPDPIPSGSGDSNARSCDLQGFNQVMFVCSSVQMCHLLSPGRPTSLCTQSQLPLSYSLPFWGRNPQLPHLHVQATPSDLMFLSVHQCLLPTRNMPSSVHVSFACDITGPQISVPNSIAAFAYDITTLDLDLTHI